MAQIPNFAPVQGCPGWHMGHRSRSAENWGAAVPSQPAPSHTGGYEASQDLPILVFTDNLPISAKITSRIAP